MERQKLRLEDIAPSGGWLGHGAEYTSRIPAMESKRITVGRQTQRERLQHAYARVAHGAGTIVAVTGEPGIGKTSLIEDFLDEARRGAHPPTIVRGQCSESLAGSEAYLPLLDAMASLLHSAHGARFESTVRTTAPMWYAQIAALTVEAASQDRMKRELAAVLGEISRDEPVVLVVDDLHWADVSTVDALSYLAGRFSELRVLVADRLSAFRYGAREAPLSPD